MAFKAVFLCGFVAFGASSKLFFENLSSIRLSSLSWLSRTRKPGGRRSFEYGPYGEVPRLISMDITCAAFKIDGLSRESPPRMKRVNVQASPGNRIDVKPISNHKNKLTLHVAILLNYTSSILRKYEEASSKAILWIARLRFASWLR